MKYLILFVLFISTSVFASPTLITISEGNMISLNDEVNDKSMAELSQKLIELCKVQSVVYLVLNTPGGSISAGMSFIDLAKGLPCRVDTITVFAASMGYQIVQNLGNRYILPSGTLMSHRASLGGLSGQVPGEIESRLAHIKDVINDLDKVAAKRTGNSLSKYQQSIHDELWLTANRSIELKHADQVALVRCDESLSGVKESSVETFMGTFKVTMSKCPLITGFLNISAPERDVLSKIKYQEVWYF